MHADVPFSASLRFSTLNTRVVQFIALLAFVDPPSFVAASAALRSVDERRAVNLAERSSGVSGGRGSGWVLRYRIDSTRWVEKVRFVLTE